LLLTLGVNTNYPNDADLPLPVATPEGKRDFMRLLKSLAPPLWEPDIHLGIENDAPRLNSIWWDRRYADQLKRSPRSCIQDWQRIVRIWIRAFERFSQEHPHDRYLGGYAQLYGVLLRMQWDKDTSRVIAQLSKLAIAYPDNKVIVIMSDWYRTLLQSFTQPRKVTSLLRSFVKCYEKQGDWHIVNIAQQMLSSREMRHFVLSQYFFSPVRRPDMVRSRQ
jgi:hypothetical protein